MSRIARIQGWLLEAPIDRPVITAFGRMHARPCLLVRLEDADGGFGWGEIWCNFPAAGGAHRLRLLDELFGPWLLGRDAGEPEALLRTATAALHTLAIQSGEHGPFAQILAGVDCAAWDLLARRAGVPLREALGGPAGPASVPAYASGINPVAPEALVAEARRAGFRAFKLKLGFAADDANLAAVTAELRPGERFMVDVNQGWDVATARRRLPELARWPLVWIEEPVAADTPLDAWAELAALAPAPLAGGENVTSEADLAALIAARVLGMVQPDIAKWGGISLARRIARATQAAGLCYCPHFLGGGVGLLGSAQLLAAMGGDGLLEVDSNPNPLRDELMPRLVLDGDGRASLPDGPGLGAQPDLAGAARWLAGAIDRR